MYLLGLFHPRYCYFTLQGRIEASTKVRLGECRENVATRQAARNESALAFRVILPHHLLHSQPPGSLLSHRSRFASEATHSLHSPATCSAVSSLALRLARLQVVPSGSPDRCAAPTPREKLTAVATAFYQRAFHHRGVTLRILRQTVQQGIQLGNIAHHETHRKTIFPGHPCHFQYIPGIALDIFIHLLQQPGSGRTRTSACGLYVAQRGEIYPRPAALNDTAPPGASPARRCSASQAPPRALRTLQGETLQHPESGR